MDVRILAESQQGATYDEQLTLAQALEDWGYDGFFRADHLVREGTAIGLTGPTDVWVTLAGLARETKRIRLGSLMCSSTFRNPAHLAIMVAQIDAMSHGRVELGLGAGSYPPEHYSLDFPLPSFGERFDAVEEQLELITGLWTAPLGQLYTYQGKKHRIQDYPALVRPVQIPHPPIIIGGHGLKRTPALAARYANEYNIDGVEPAACTQAYDRVRKACERIDRDPAEITFSAAVTLCVGTSKTDIDRRTAVLHDRVGEDPTTIIANGLCGSPAEVIDRLAAFEDAGAERVYLQLFDLTDLDQLQLFADDVLPRFANGDA